MSQKKKWTDHPIHPIPSSVKKIGGGAWYPVAGVLGESTERLLKSLPSAHKYRAYGTNTCNFLINGSGSTMVLKRIHLVVSRERLP